MSYTNVDAKLKPICVKMFNSNDMKNGELHANFLKDWWTQLGKNGTIKDLKTRIHDHFKSAGFKIEMDDLRLWLYTKNDNQKDEDLKRAITSVSKGFKGDLSPVESPNSQPEDEIELNSGVEFPGQCLEPLMNTALRIH